MPRLSDSMEEGTIVRWLVGDGESVAAGEEIAEIESDKANMMYEAEAGGPLQILVAEGETVAVGARIAQIGADAAAAATPPRSLPATARPRRRQAATPVARRLAAERGIDLAEVPGSGPGGRIGKADVEAYAGGAGGPPEPGAKPEKAPSPVGAKGEPKLLDLSRAQQTVARRMSESKATVPDFSLVKDLDMDAAVAFRDALKRDAGGRDVPSLNDMVVKACALALREHERVNGAYRDGRWEVYPRVNVGIAVDRPTASLVVPTVFDADRLSLGEIATTTRGLAARARDGSITAAELSGGTFTVSNLGMLGVDSFTAIVNRPQAALLAVGAIRRGVSVRDDRAEVGWRMSVTLCCDHRILSGGDGARFLADVTGLLQSPGALVL